MIVHVTRREQTGNRGHHPVVGDEVTARIMLHVLLDEPGVRPEADEDEGPGRREL